MKAKINLNGLVSVTKEVHGVEVRGLNFADLSAQWQTNGQSMIEAYNAIVASGEVGAEASVQQIVNAVIKHAPNLGRTAFLAAINDDGSLYEVGGEMLTAAQVWDTKMSFGKQGEILLAILELTLAESDNLKKKLLGWTERLPVAQQTLRAQVAEITTQ